MDATAYLRRIGFDGPLRRDRATLEALQRAHLTAVPFENLHVFHHRGVHTDPMVSMRKVVEEGRGGWCYELNGAFWALLNALGFEARLLAATVLFGEDPGTGPQPDHAALEVILDRPYLVDVGFGDSFIRPLPLDTTEPCDGGSGRFRVTAGEFVTLQQWQDEAWADRYRFARTPVTHHVFEPSSRYLQSDGRGWSGSPFATRLLNGGPDRVTLLSNRIKFRRNGTWQETPVPLERWAEELLHWFGLTP